MAELRIGTTQAGTTEARQWPMPDWAGDLGLNLGAEAAGVLVTILVVDRWARRREAKRIRPILAAALRDAERIYREAMSLVERALLSSATIDDLSLLREPGMTLGDERLNRVFDRLTMGQFVNVAIAAPTLPLQHWRWGDWLPQCAQDIRRRIDQFQERYNFIVSPKLYAAVHELAHHHVIVMGADYGTILRPGHQRLPGGFTSLARDIQPLRDALRQLRGEIAPERVEDDEMLSHVVIARVVPAIEQYPARCDAAPYRPA